MGRGDIGCSGTFVCGRTILTAGYCVHKDNTVQMANSNIYNFAVQRTAIQIMDITTNGNELSPIMDGIITNISTMILQ